MRRRGRRCRAQRPETDTFLGERQLAPPPRKLSFSAAREEEQGPGRRDQGEDSLELACALEEKSSYGSGAGRVKNIPKIAQPEPKPAS